MAPVFSNNATSLLAVAINAAVTTVTVQTGDAAKFPAPTGGDWFPVTVLDGLGNMEIMRCTARSGANLTVVRGQEGTTAQSFSIGARVDLRMTAAALAEFRSMIDGKSAPGHGHIIGDVSGLSGALAGKSDTGHTHAASETASGQFADARMPERLTAHGRQITTDWNTATTVGFYSSARGTDGVLNTPDGPSGTQWWTGIVLSYQGSWTRQIVWRIDALAADTVCYMRTYNSATTTWGAWYRLRTSEAELDARFFQRGEVTASDPDLNTLTTVGSYQLTGGTPTNGPAGVPYANWQLLVFGGNTTRTQVLASYNSERVFFRGGINSGSWTWQSWREVLHPGNNKGSNGVASTAANFTASASQMHKPWILYSAAHTVTLPLAATLGQGAILGPFKCIDPIIGTITRAGSDTIRPHNGIGSLTSITLAQGQELYLVSDGSATWEAYYTKHTVLLAKAEFSTVSQVVLALPPGFRRFVLDMGVNHGGGAGKFLAGQLSTDGGSTWISAGGSYTFDYNNRISGSGYANGQTSNTYMELLTAVSSAQPESFVEIDIINARESAYRTMLYSRMVAADNDAGSAPASNNNAAAWRNASEDNNALRLFPTSGTMNGYYTLRGIG